MLDTSSVIVITGAAGFIGSCLTGFLNDKGYKNLVLVDDFSRADKEYNLTSKSYDQRVDREQFFEWLTLTENKIDFVFHIGARTDTTEFDYAVHQHFNVDYTIKLWNYCTNAKVPMVYASSAATYGAGELGYKDDHAIIPQLKPLNPYGVSKNEVDKWILQQETHPPFWAGLKFFNVYGPNEFHKARMASVIFHSFNQIQKNGSVKLFKSHRPDFEDGQQLRDFIYVKDVLKICYWLMNNQPASGIYNVGTGKARSFEALVNATFKGMDLEPNIEYIDMPMDLRETYQYFTEADMHKLRDAGYSDEFYSLEEGVDEYVRSYLSKHTFY
jgi:ADP-L-glycero-D-manno-heptose 6-epimerase